jgi:hypothetical protein
MAFDLRGTPATPGRSHLRRDGRPKVTYDRLKDAARVAAGRSVPGELFVAYRCPHCDGFHVGHPRLVPDSVDDAEWIELGDRVVWHLRRENRKPARPRRTVKDAFMNDDTVMLYNCMGRTSTST